MKVAVVGNGNVGMAVFSVLQNMPEIQEIALVGRNQEKIKAEIADYRDALILRNNLHCWLTGGDYDQVEDADIIIYTAGAHTGPQARTRLDLLNNNRQVMKEVFEQLDRYNKDAIVIVLSNPVDILTKDIVKLTGRPANKVLGTGTLLDAARLKRYIGELLDISGECVNIYVIGEHGDTSCIAWSSLNLLGMTFDEYLSQDIGDSMYSSKEDFTRMVRKSAYKIVKGQGFTAYGVAAAAARVVSAIINDTHEVLPVTTLLHGEYGVDDLAISVPCMIGREGVLHVYEMKLTDEEREQFEASVKKLREIGG